MSDLTKMAKDAVGSASTPIPTLKPTKSPAWGPSGKNLRNFAQMNPAKFNDLVYQMEAYRDKDPEGYAAVQAEARKRTPAR